jgi:hypothetical protein
MVFGSNSGVLFSSTRFSKNTNVNNNPKTAAPPHTHNMTSIPEMKDERTESSNAVELVSSAAAAPAETFRCTAS